jgi:aminoglycoside/choline kinase family phosphotransferase
MSASPFPSRYLTITWTSTAPCAPWTEDGFDEAAFRQAYAVLGAQRATKILGIFARLAKRDDKPGYLRFLPRTSEVLEICLSHPAMGDVRTWFDQHLPAGLRDRGPA